MSADAKASLVFIPFPVMSHLVSTVELAKLLVGRDHRLYVTILLMKLPMDTKITSYTNTRHHPRMNFLELQENKSISEKSTRGKSRTLGFVESQKGSARDGVAEMMRFVESQKGSARDAVAEMMKSGSRVAGFVLDMFCTPMIDVANELGAPSYIFFPAGSASLGLMLHLQSLKDDHGWDLKEYENSDKEVSVPTYVNPVPAKVWPVSVFEEGFSLLEFVKRYRETRGIVINTFLELESHSINSLSADHNVLPVYPVGPMIQGGEGKDGSSEKKQKHDEIGGWLDEQPDSSVVFLCFGTAGSFQNDQVKEIAVALEQSGQRFLWSLRKPPPEGTMEFPGEYEDPAEALPEGFLERCVATGKVIGWAPQMEVLSHPAVGGFVSHCGWNSTLESVWCGVPIAAWPLAAEQQANAFLLVKEFEMAVEIKIDYRKNSDVIVAAETIQKAIGQLMDPDNKIRVKVKELQEKSRVSIAEAGSSYNFLGRLVESVMDPVS